MDKDNNRMETNDRFSKSGMTKTRWRDEIVKFAGMTWMRTAQDRSKWYQLGVTFALSGLTMAEMMMPHEIMWDIM